MEFIKLLYASLMQELSEKEFLLEKLMNFPSDIPNLFNDCKEVLKEISTIKSSINTLDEMIAKNTK